MQHYCIRHGLFFPCIACIAEQADQKITTWKELLNQPKKSRKVNR